MKKTQLDDELVNNRFFQKLQDQFNVSKSDFLKKRKSLSKKFDVTASINDTAWGILNHLLLNYSKKGENTSQIYLLMAQIRLSEGKDPTELMLEASKSAVQANLTKKGKYKKIGSFLFHEELAIIRHLRSEGKLEVAENILLQSIPTPAVLDELRKIASTRARQAKIKGDWEKVVYHLEKYNQYAQVWDRFCFLLVTSEAPIHTKTDQKLLEKANEMLKK